MPASHACPSMLEQLFRNAMTIDNQQSCLLLQTYPLHVCHRLYRQSQIVSGWVMLLCWLALSYDLSNVASRAAAAGAKLSLSSPLVPHHQA